MAQSGYVGKAGQLAAMAEFLLRGYNVAMPEVDVGDDIFVVEDQEGQFWRIQVKAAIGKRRRYGYSGKFAVSLQQLYTPKKPDLFYVFALRAGDRWEFVVIPRETLKGLHNVAGIGNVVAGHLILNCRLTATRALCSGIDLQAHRNNWDEWPVIQP
ncbi:MAG TPA: hypothetical protein VKA46_37410 [Gemmataceae bacterium]|nr:hypothetical protein [Gemmataceae bacterium]